MTPRRSTRRTISVAIVDDNQLVREALAGLLRQIADFQVAATGVADEAFMHAAAPDVVLLDIGLVDDDSLRVATALNERAPGTRVVMMDLLPMDEDIVQFVNAGVSGFVLKDATVGEFVVAIRTVAAGGKVLPPSLTESLFSQIVKLTEPASDHTPDEVRITPREREVVALIGEGLSNTEIAERLDIASHTVKSHVRNVMEKLALHTRLQIAAYVRRDRPAPPANPSHPFVR